MSHHQIPGLVGPDQAERCDGNLSFASRLVSCCRRQGHWAGQGFVEVEIPFRAAAPMVGFDPGRPKIFIFQWGLTDSLSATLRLSSPETSVTERTYDIGDNLVPNGLSRVRFAITRSPHRRQPSRAPER